MHAVCHLSTFARAAKRAGLTESEVSDIEVYLAENPATGDEIPGTGGCRELRWPGYGKGKRGGYRIVTLFSGQDMPVFLITIFAKGEKINLTKTERNDLRAMTKLLVDEYTSHR